MKYITLTTNQKMPIIGLGTWKSVPGEVYRAVRWALKLGYTHFDCAPIYGNQAEIGQALHDAFNEDQLKREDLFITSKLWNDSHHPDDVLPALETTLQELGLEYLDLWLMHWPVAQKKGTAMPTSAEDVIAFNELPPEITWAAMEKCFQDGKVKAIGTSNFGPENLGHLIEKGEIAPAVNQVECHPYLQQKELLEFCRNNMIAVTAYSPLGSGIHDQKPQILEEDVIIDIARRLNATPAQVALAWQINRGIAVIPKSVHENHLRENMAALQLELDNADMAQIDQLDQSFRYIDGKGFAFGDNTAEKIFA